MRHEYINQGAVSSTEELQRKDVINRGMHTQSKPGLCGIAAIRSVLHGQYGVLVSEEEIVKRVCHLYSLWDNRNGEKFFRNNGTSPRVMSDCIRSYVANIKVFCSRQGNVATLDRLVDQEIVPVIHTELGDEGDKEGHYMIYRGRNNDTVTVFNPWEWAQFCEYNVDDFEKMWDVGEKWYLASMPLSAKIPQGLNVRFL